MNDAYVATQMRRLELFAREHFHTAAEDLQEHQIFAFLELSIHAEERDTPRGVNRRAGIKRTLPLMVDALDYHFRRRGLRSPITKAARGYAYELRDTHAPNVQRPIPMLVNELKDLIDVCDSSKPRDLWIRTLLLCVWTTWARPSEILRRLYPDDVDESRPQGLVIRLPRSKTNPASRYEHHVLVHHKDPMYCPLCSLRQWLDVLGPSYRGPLFPWMHHQQIVPKPCARRLFTYLLKGLQRRAWGRVAFSPYSARRGPANVAAMRRWNPDAIRRGLRQRSVSTSSIYIDPSALLGLIGRLS